MIAPGGLLTNGALEAYFDGVFRIGAESYGSVPSGAVIEVRPAGVTIDGELRGPLPPGAGQAADED